MMSSSQSEIHFPMARNTDPKTSHDAAEHHRQTNLGKRRNQTLDLVKSSQGNTAGEYGRQFFETHPELPIRVAAQTPQKRLPELEKLGLVRRGEPRICRDSGRNCATWWLA